MPRAEGAEDADDTAPAIALEVDLLVEDVLRAWAMACRGLQPPLTETVDTRRRRTEWIRRRLVLHPPERSGWMTTAPRLSFRAVPCFRSTTERGDAG